MQHAARITMEQRNGNLHLTLAGSFSPDSASRLTELMDQGYTGAGNIFVHTKMLTEIAPDSRSIFAELLRASALPQERLYFTGAKGLAIAPEASKVIVQQPAPGHGGCGRCQSCSCREKKAA